MEHAAHLVDILDTQGRPIGVKPRSDIDKRVDIYHTIYVMLVTPNREIVLSEIPQRNDLPNLYIHQLGTTVATIRRHGETVLQAARRGLHKELYIDKKSFQFIGERMVHLPDGRQTYVTLYYIVHELPSTYSTTDISKLVTITPERIHQRLKNNSNDFAPTFRMLWDTYHTHISAHSTSG